MWNYVCWSTKKKTQASQVNWVLLLRQNVFNRGAVLRGMYVSTPFWWTSFEFKKKKKRRNNHLPKCAEPELTQDGCRLTKTIPLPQPFLGSKLNAREMTHPSPLPCKSSSSQGSFLVLMNPLCPLVCRGLSALPWPSLANGTRSAPWNTWLGLSSLEFLPAMGRAILTAEMPGCRRKSLSQILSTWLIYRNPSVLRTAQHARLVTTP